MKNRGISSHLLIHLVRWCEADQSWIWVKPESWHQGIVGEWGQGLSQLSSHVKEFVCKQGQWAKWDLLIASTSCLSSQGEGSKGGDAKEAYQCLPFINMKWLSLIGLFLKIWPRLNQSGEDQNNSYIRRWVLLSCLALVKLSAVNWPKCLPNRHNSLPTNNML